MTGRGRLLAPVCGARLTVALCCAVTLLIGITCLAGYVLGIRALTGLAPALPVTSVITSVLLCLFAVGLASRMLPGSPIARRVGSICIGAALAIEGTVITEYLTGRSFGIDQMLFADRVQQWMPGPQPGRQSPHTAAFFLILGAGLLLIDATIAGFEPFRLFAPLIVVLALASALGQIYGVSYLYGTGTVNGTSVPSVAGFLLLATAYVMLRTGRYPVSLLFSLGVGGRMTRRLIPSAVTVIAVVGALVALTGRWGGALRGLDVMAAIAVLLIVMYVALVRAARLLESIGVQQDELNSTLTWERDLNNTILGALHDGVVTSDADGVIVAANDRFSDMIGLPADEILGQRPPYSWWTPEQRNQAITPPQRSALRARVTTETEILRGDGSRLAVARATSAAYTADHDVAVYVVTYTDLTERNEVRAERRTLLERLDHFFDISGDLMCVAGMDGYFKHLNPAWERTLGYPLQQVFDIPYMQCVHPDDRQDAQHNLQALVNAEGGSFSFETRFRHANGQYRWLSWTATPSPAERLIYAVARDITDERADRDARAQLAAIVESTDDAVLTKSPDGIITGWNAGAEHIYGYTADEAIGRPLSLIYPPEQLATAHASLAQALRGEAVKDHEHIGQTKDRAPVHLSVTISALRDLEGTITGVSCIARDITDRIREQADLATARDQAQAADRAKSEFVATVSHEIRTPLNGIIGLNTLMLGTDLQPSQRRFATGINTSAETLLAIINDVLDFSKIEAGKVLADDVDFDLTNVIADALRIAAESARGKDIDVIAGYPPDLQPVRYGDPGRLRQVLINLLGNAVKFTHRGQVRLNVTEQHQDGRCQFTISDTGIGIAPDVLAKLFEPFVQAEQSDNRTYGGTGLGLAISYKLVTVLGGHLDARSTPGVGSTFSFTLPLPTGTAPNAPARSASTLLVGRRLLIASNNSAQAELLTEHARFWGMAVTTTNADALLTDTPASGAISYDIVAVDADAATPLEPIASIARRVRLVLLAGDPADTERLAERAGAVDVLHRPVDPSSFLDCLLRLFSSGTETLTVPALQPQHHGRVLVAEDNEINQLVAEEFLTELGYQVDIAHNGQQAIDMADQNEYVAVLMDCQMPKVDGYQATVQLRASEPPDRHVPIIAMTASAMAADRQRCLDAGMDDCITKPVDLHGLGETLAEWIQRSR
ncbi:PAS domain S-box protein [Actinoplanes sp. L3-i22]|uniref:PAS domain S-box protein n=1 Tax=Actinoplanes sp. L3-i22 TaxID=2836373 RepID=UPI001C75F6CF|nr:PAS domain S-box protein [Actinoplanes sp. L3-i22]BCY08996.1 hypothetical protein L3i22_040840 [Actinoplanes sp. L3-i22]